MSDRSIKECIRKMSGTYNQDTVYYIDGEVTSVNKVEQTCEVLVVFGHAEYALPDVRLSAAICDGVVIYPAVDSSVKVVFSNNNEPFIAQYSEVESVDISAEANIRFNDGSLGGIVTAKELVKQLNAIEQSIIDLKNIIIAWEPTYEVALKTLLNNWTNKILSKTQEDAIVNKKITHGI